MKPLRSFLFVPADSERKFRKAVESGADALILDLEDSVAPDRKEAAREMLQAFLRTEVAPQLWVRINSSDTSWYQADVEAVEDLEPAGVVFPKADSASATMELNSELGGRTPILVIATETPRALLSAHTYLEIKSNLYGLTWGAEDLYSALGAAEGASRKAADFARTLCLIGARAAAVQPVDAAFMDYKNDEGLRAEARQAYLDGFTGKLAIHPAQVPVINEAFTPTAEELAFARRVVEAFAGGEGVVGLDGRMLDRPHLVRAQELLALSGET